jgi:hypothetical protein
MAPYLRHETVARMKELTELYCTYDEDHDEWLVWFPFPLGGKEVIESFDNEADARKFWQAQMDGADYS